MSEPTSVRSKSIHIDALRFIRRSTAAHGYPPSVREIGTSVGYSSASSAQAIFNGLKRRGWIKHIAGQPRAYTITKDGLKVLGE